MWLPIKQALVSPQRGPISFMEFDVASAATGIDGGVCEGLVQVIRGSM